MNLKLNNLLVELQEVEHATESGIILDQEGDKFVDYGKLVQDAEVRYSDRDNTFTIPAGTKIIYSKNKFIPIKEHLGVVEFHNVIGWEEI